MLFRKANQKDYNEILTIWEKSVLATHDFLKDKDNENATKFYIKSGFHILNQSEIDSAR